MTLPQMKLPGLVKALGPVLSVGRSHMLINSSEEEKLALKQGIKNCGEKMHFLT